MRVIVAVPFEHGGVRYAPDEEADLPDAVAKEKLRDGWARRPAAVEDGPAQDPVTTSLLSLEQPAQSTHESPTPGATETE